MAADQEKAARDRRQERVAKAVWGLLFMTVGALFILDDQGRIDLRERSKLPASQAVDGDPGTRWSSAFSDPQWITIDLGAPVEIARVKLNWETAFATAYRIEVSNDGSHWTTVKDVKDGDGGIDEYEISSRGRYVRVLGTTRATPYGFSLWEMEVYGPGESASPLSRGREATASSTERAGYWVLWSVYWPVFLVAGGLPHLLVPKDGGEQVFGLIVTGCGAFLLLQKLGYIPWTLAQTWPVLLLLAGLLLVTQALAQRKGGSGGSSTLGDGTGSMGGDR